MNCFDPPPAGQSMPLAAARKIEYFSRKNDLDLDIRLYPLILTADQCKQYHLPRTPIKDSERRAGVFEARHGAGATELDALEALHPGELRKIVIEAVDHYYDSDLQERAEDWYVQWRSWLDEAETEAIHPRQEEIAQLRSEYKNICAEMKCKTKDISERILTVWHCH